MEAKGQTEVVADMALRLTQEEYDALIKRRARASAHTIATIETAREAEAPDGPVRRRSKYGNRKVEIDNMRFDSRHEAGVWLMLQQRVRAGELKLVMRQVPFDLPGGIRYIADFVAVRPDMTIEAVIDAKSEITKKNRVYINKKKQMKACLGIEIKEM